MIYDQAEPFGVQFDALRVSQERCVQSMAVIFTFRCGQLGERVRIEESRLQLAGPRKPWQAIPYFCGRCGKRRPHVACAPLVLNALYPSTH